MRRYALFRAFLCLLLLMVQTSLVAQAANGLPIDPSKKIPLKKDPVINIDPNKKKTDTQKDLPIIGVITATCTNSDQDKIETFIPPKETPKKLITEKMLSKKGSMSWKIDTAGNNIDFIKSKAPKDIKFVGERAYASDICIDSQTVKEYLCANVGLAATQASGVFAEVSCPFGTVCSEGACVADPNQPKNKGCLVNQKPFLDVTGDGVPESCQCPEGFYPFDSDKNGNDDLCFKGSSGATDPDKGFLCPKIINPSKFPDATVVKLIDPKTGKENIAIKSCVEASEDDCSLPMVKQVICDGGSYKSYDVTNCPQGTTCSKGMCQPSNEGKCVSTYMDLSSAEPGWVELYDAQGNLVETVYDTCDGDVPDKVWNAKCADGCKQSTDWEKTKCDAGKTCESFTYNGHQIGACMKPQDDGVNCQTNPSNPACASIDCIEEPSAEACQGVDCLLKPADPACQDDDGVNCKLNPNQYACQGMDCKSEPENTKCKGVDCKMTPDAGACKVCDKIAPAPSCKNETDPQEDEHVFGTLDIESKYYVSCQYLASAVAPKPDACVSMPNYKRNVLYQYSCNGAAVGSAVGACSNPDEDCDPLAGTAAQRGVCKKFNKPTCNDTSPDFTEVASAADVGVVSGVDGFGHAFSFKDACVPGVNFDRVKKYSCSAEGSQGYSYTLVACEDGFECVDGYCHAIKPPDPFGCAANPGDIACTDKENGAGDGWPAYSDNCPDAFNPDQKDGDGDGIGDVCDTDPDKVQDTDGDGIKDTVDNCCTIPNAGQEDTDEDGTGDACPAAECSGSGDAVCVGLSASCTDYDKSSNPNYAGIVFINQGQPSEVSQSDFCVDDGTAVIEVGCSPDCGGEGYRFHYLKKGCGADKTCQNGACGEVP